MTKETNKIKEEIEKEEINFIEFTGFIRTNKNTYVIRTNNIFEFEKQLNKLLDKLK
jgi:hypothetical protein